MNLFDEFVSHHDVSLVTNRHFLRDESFTAEEGRLMKTLQLHPSTFRSSSKKPMYWIRIRESATKKRLGDFHFFEPGGLYRSDLVHAALLVVQRNRRFREARRPKEEHLPWKQYLVYYVFGISLMFLIFVMIKYFQLDEDRL